MEEIERLTQLRSWQKVFAAELCVPLKRAAFTPVTLNTDLAYLETMPSIPVSWEAFLHSPKKDERRCLIVQNFLIIRQKKTLKALKKKTQNNQGEGELSAVSLGKPVFHQQIR